MYGLTQTVAPVEEPITVAEAKADARVDFTDADDQFEDWIAEATRSIEDETGRQFVSATYAMTLDCFPDGDGEIRFPKNPVVSVTSVVYVASDGTSTTMDSSDYQLSSKQIVSRLRPAYGESWPVARDQMDAVTITFVAGYGLAASVPRIAKGAVKKLVTHWWNNPDAVITSGAIPKEVPFSVQRLIDQLKTGEVR